jgi:hypothetical protein
LPGDAGDLKSRSDRIERRRENLLDTFERTARRSHQAAGPLIVIGVEENLDLDRSGCCRRDAENDK